MVLAAEIVQEAQWLQQRQVSSLFQSLITIKQCPIILHFICVLCCLSDKHAEDQHMSARVTEARVLHLLRALVGGLQGESCACMMVETSNLAMQPFP